MFIMFYQKKDVIIIDRTTNFVNHRLTWLIMCMRKCKQLKNLGKSSVIQIMNIAK